MESLLFLVVPILEYIHVSYVCVMYIKYNKNLINMPIDYIYINIYAT